jgi:hypothetical protein
VPSYSMAYSMLVHKAGHNPGTGRPTVNTALRIGDDGSIRVKCGGKTTQHGSGEIARASRVRNGVPCRAETAFLPPSSVDFVAFSISFCHDYVLRLLARVGNEAQARR